MLASLVAAVCVCGEASRAARARARPVGVGKCAVQRGVWFAAVCGMGKGAGRGIIGVLDGRRVVGRRGRSGAAGRAGGAR